MSGPGPTMKTIQKRFYTAIPRAAAASSSNRVRAGSVSRSLHTAPLPFFPLPPPPSSRPGNPHILSGTRLPVELRTEGEPQPSQHHQSLPYSLALTSPQTNSHPSSFFPYATFSYSPPYTTYVKSPPESCSSSKRHRHRYHLDVGAYGIPKRCNSKLTQGRFSYNKSSENLDLAVQIGEDSYFIRENAMGVADGVGGWARHAEVSSSRQSTIEPSSSALFARRLMHYCSSEVACASHPEPSLRQATSSWYPTIQDLEEDLEDSLEELEEGIDILNILEKAYESTLKAHVVTPETRLESSPTITSPKPLPHLNFSPPPPDPVPLLTGSSTALIAVLDYARHPPESSTSPPVQHSGDAVIHIAHLGDCLGMLIRGDDIVWRSEEMWWNFNTPVQLGPRSPARPQDAQVLTLPVQADDILILASDGLSDNLWDEDVLDEVSRFRQSFMPGVLGRRTLAGMLSEALCSRARRVSMRRTTDDTDEVPFARRAREQGRSFHGGKNDDISVVVAVISPAEISR